MTSNQTSATANYDTMGKEALRAACRVAGISYSKLNNDGMRAALTAHYAPTPATPTRNAFDHMVAPVSPKEHKGSTTRVVDGKKIAGDKPAPREARIKLAPVPRTARKGYSIQRDREERNGVKRPSEGTVCGAVWAEFDKMHNSGDGLKAADLAPLADKNGWNRANVSCEYYTWRKFMGIKGRAAK